MNPNMVKVYIRLLNWADIDFIVMWLQPHDCLSEIRVLRNHLSPKFIQMSCDGSVWDWPSSHLVIRMYI